MQDLTVTSADRAATLYETVAACCAGWNETHAAGIGLVVGATYPSNWPRFGGIAPNLPILLPGVGAQAGELGASVNAGIDANGRGLLVSSSRGITYASQGEDFAEAARAAAIQSARCSQRGARRAGVSPHPGTASPPTPLPLRERGARDGSPHPLLFDGRGWRLAPGEGCPHLPNPC